ncbi:coiled-coil domain-containing protein 134-like [Watersipora subatra]|uniref:coiled-coil domain-containing protein 134-like n=1 Tax=Watersipora subatra TaxID=2589382 RepID=UPI00355B36B8
MAIKKIFHFLYATRVVVFVYTLITLFQIGCSNEDKAKDELISGEIKGINTWEAYKSLLETQRKAHKEAVKQLLSFTNTQKQYEMLNLVTKRLVEILAESKSELLAAGFSPTGDFPEDEQLRDSLSQVIQNSLLYADLALRFPSFMHRVFDRQKVSKSVVKWCFEFTRETRVTEGTPSAQAIYLASQELNYIEREDNYTNPFVDEQEIKLSKLVEEEMKKKKTKKERGPRLSSRRTEL